MTRPNRRFVKTSLFLLFSSLVLIRGAPGQGPETLPTRRALVFDATPAKQLLARGEPVVLDLRIYNWSERPLFVSRLNDDEFLDFNVFGPDGKELPRQGKGRTDAKGYSPSDFAVLEKYTEIRIQRTISLRDGAGFVFDKPGQYTVTAEYTPGPPEQFAPFAGEAKIPTGSFHSTKAAFCIEVCVPDPSPGQNQAIMSSTSHPHKASQDALEAVRFFYTNIIQFHPLGLPQAQAKNALWPLLSQRLVQELDSLQACEDDYYRRYGEILRANQYKPATPWLEEGLFSGSDEAADPIEFTILGSRAIGKSRAEVHLGFTYGQTYCCGEPTEHGHYEGLVTTILENNRWLIDDFVAMDANNSLDRLSDGYPQCKDGKWVDLPEDPPY